jgi:hypothetical protein
MAALLKRVSEFLELFLPANAALAALSGTDDGR